MIRGIRVAAAVGLAAAMMVSTGHAGLSMDRSALLNLLGASASNVPAGKMVFVTSGTIKFIDLRDSQLAIKTVAVKTVADRSLIISPDGNYLVWVGSRSAITVSKIAENTSEIIEFGKNGLESRPSWYQDKSSGKWYIIYGDGASATNDLVAQQITLSPLATAGSPISIIKPPTYRVLSEYLKINGPAISNRNYGGIHRVVHEVGMNDKQVIDTMTITDSLWVWAGWLTSKNPTCGTATIGAECSPTGNVKPASYQTFASGTSADLRFCGAMDDGHGVVELENPGVTGANKIKQRVNYGSYYGWNQLMISGTRPENFNSRMGGYCNGHMSPAGPGHQYYGCVLHTGGGHTEIHVRRWPTDFSKEEPYIVTFSQRKSSAWFTEPGESICMFKSPKGEFRGVFAANPWFACVVVAGDANRPYLYSLAKPSAPQGAAVLTEGVNNFHLWLDPSFTPSNAEPVSVMPGRATGRKAGGARLLRVAGGVVRLKAAANGPAIRLTLHSVNGALVRTTAAGSRELSTSGLPGGMYVARLSDGAAVREAAPVLVKSSEQ